MTQSLEDIQQDERLLEKELDQVTEGRKHLRQLEEEYEEFFHYTSTLFSEMQEQFRQTDFTWYLSEQLDGLQHRETHIFGELDEERQQLNRKQRDIEDTQSELSYARESILANEEVSMNEC
ncbi:DUF3958 family protein [Enterococcus sp. BWR-S5]|uniref:DUF3958 family protein n=1 Tax=Enterococcus sp. BWR-S5 TaxID=2787714 RepID=UPI0019244E8D|nr:DUF3958 family protein [Enterococcus sp. BWR-S5]MBL1224253.1 DUF3958 family protein [Enterococcus sp. BWR-S5]